MSKVRHTRELEPILPAEGVTFWQARSYRVSGRWIEAEAGSTWRPATPVAYYKPAGKEREVEAGPHLSFLRLRALVGEGMWDELFQYRMEMKVFADIFGLLGVIDEDYLLPPILPSGKLFVAPEAVIEPDGELRQVNHAEGVDLVLDLLSRQTNRWGSEKRRDARRVIALPSEVKLLPRPYRGPWRDPYRPDLESEGWEETKEKYGGLLVLDENSATRVSVLSTRESVVDWWRVLADFPSGDYQLKNPILKRYLNSRLVGISPYSPENEDEFRRGWRCTSLLQAMCLMLWLDLTGGRSVRECALRDCSNYFREGSQPDPLYCSPKHSSLASTRMSRRQRP